MVEKTTYIMCVTSSPNVQLEVDVNDELFNAQKTTAKSTSICHKDHFNGSPLEFIIIFNCLSYSSLYSTVFSFSFAYTDWIWTRREYYATSL